MPAARAFCAIAWPTLAAASTFLPFFRPSRTSAWVVLAAASTFEPSALNSWAYRCWPVRSTDRRGTPSSRMCARVDLARRRRAIFFSMVSGLRKLKGLALIEHLCLLGFLADDVFAGVLDALALVRLRRTEAADLGCNLADLLLVGAGDHDLGLGRGGDGDAFRGREQHRMREAQRQVQVLALHGGAVTHADQLELALEAFGNALDHVGHDRAQGSGQRHQLDVVGRQGGDAVLDLDLDAFGLGDRQVALRALDADAIGLDVELDALGDGDRLLGYTRHVLCSLRPRSTGPHHRRPAGAPGCRS